MSPATGGALAPGAVESWAAGQLATAGSLPPLPKDASTCWPRRSALASLAAIPWHLASLRGDLVGRSGLSEGSGTSDLLLIELGRWAAKCAGRRHFASSTEAGAALVDLARSKRLLGGLRPPGTTLYVCPRGSTWQLWTFCLWLPTLRGEMVQAAADDELLASHLAAYGRAAVEAIRLGARRGLLLDVHPSNFARSGAASVYLDDDFRRGRLNPTIGHALLQRVEEYGDRPTAVAGYLAAIETAARERLTGADVAAVGVITALSETAPRSAVAAAAQRRLERAFWRLP